MDKNLKKSINLFEIVGIISFFIISSVIVQQNAFYLKNYLDIGILGPIFYVFLVSLAIVIAPISAVPLIPLASELWGVFNSALLNILGWTLGAYIAFSISRRYGIPLVSRIIPLEKIYKIQSYVPKKNIFWGIVLLRMVLPVDVLSYALGIFCKIRKRDYLLATLIGVTPFAFIFAYVGTLSVIYQIFFILLAIIVIVLGYILKTKKLF